jgi:hypothetical protein
MTDVAVVDEAVRTAVITQNTNYSNVVFGYEIRKAELYSEFTIGKKKFSVHLVGARGCSTEILAYSSPRTTLVYNLVCDLTFFSGDHPELGPITIIDDPRRKIVGQIFLRRTSPNSFRLPGLSYFNQYLVFNIGKHFFYYPSPWQVVSAISHWPPEYHQYHHLEEDTPLYDFNTREPNVARKGVSTISILGPLTPAEEQDVRAAHARHVEKVKAQRGYAVAPEDFLSSPRRGRRS